MLNVKGFKSLVARRLSRFYPSERYILIGGSEGKSTAVRLTKAIISKKFEVIASDGGGNYLEQATSVVLRARKSLQRAVIKMGLETADQIGQYLKLFKPGSVIITNLSLPRGEFVGDLASLERGLKAMLTQLDKNCMIVLNWDDPNSRRLAEGLEERVVFFGTDPKHCHIWASNIRIENFRTRFELNYGVERVDINSPLLGFHQVYPQLASACLGVNYGVPLTTIKLALESYQPAPSHMEVLSGFNGSTVIDDSCQMSLLALLQAIDSLNYISAKRRILLLSDIDGIADDVAKVHKELAFKIFRDKIDYCFLIGQSAENTKEELLKLGYSSERIELEPKNNQVISKLVKIVSKGDVVLVKGVKNFQLKEAVRRLTSARG